MKFVVCGLLAGCLIAPALADNNVYLSAGYSVLSDEYSDGNANAFTIRGGFFFNRYLGIEGEASTGLTGVDILAVPGVENGVPVNVGLAQFKLDRQYAGYLVGRLQSGPNFAFLGRVGYGSLEYKLTGTATNLPPAPASPRPYEATLAELNGFTAGLGFQYFFTEHLGGRLDVTHMFASDSGLFEDVDVLTSSLAYRF